MKDRVVTSYIAGRGDVSGRFRILRSGRSRLIMLLALVVLLATAFVIADTLTNKEDAVKEIPIGEAQAFPKNSAAYNFARLDSAVAGASNQNCEGARLTYDQVATDPKGISDIDMQAYKKRIDDICSGKTQRPPIDSDQE